MTKLRKTIKLRLNEVRIDPYRFQERKPIANGSRRYGVAKKRSADHITEMTEYLQENKDAQLDPLKVWRDPVERCWQLVDGFHRSEAYRVAWRPNRKIACEIIEASNDHEARKLVFLDNSKAQLGFTQAERIEAAWMEVCRLEKGYETYSARKLGKQFRVSHDTIYRMKKMTDKIREENRGKIPVPVSPWIVYRNGSLGDMKGLIDAQQFGRATSKLVSILEGHGSDIQVELLQATTQRLNELNIEKHPEGSLEELYVAARGGDEDF
jgi:hypothetical protein